MIMENMYQAKTNLSKLVDKAVEGEEVILAKAGKPVVRLVPCEDAAEPVKMGLMKGKIKIADDFDNLSPEVADIFEGYLE